MGIVTATAILNFAPPSGGSAYNDPCAVKATANGETAKNSSKTGSCTSEDGIDLHKIETLFDEKSKKIEDVLDPNILKQTMDNMRSLGATNEQLSSYQAALDREQGLNSNESRNSSKTIGTHYSGEGDPPASLGVEGDTYTNTITGENFIKQGSAPGEWVSTGYQETVAEILSVSLGTQRPCQVTFTRFFPSMMPDSASIKASVAGIAQVYVQTNRQKPEWTAAGQGLKRAVYQGQDSNHEGKKQHVYAVEYEVSAQDLIVNAQGTDLEVQGGWVSDLLFSVYGNTKTAKTNIKRVYNLKDVTLPVRIKRSIEAYREAIINRTYPDSDVSMTGDEYWDIEQPTKIVYKDVYEFVSPINGESKGYAGIQFRVENLRSDFPSGQYKQIGSKVIHGTDPTDGGKNLWA